MARAVLFIGPNLRGSFNNQLWSIRSGLAAGEADGSAAWRGHSEVVGAVACDIGCDVDADPCSCSDRTSRANRAAQERRVVVGDARLGPGIVADTARHKTGTRGAVGKDTQRSFGDRAVQSLHGEAQIAADNGRAIHAQGG